MMDAEENERTGIISAPSMLRTVGKAGRSLRTRSPHVQDTRRLSDHSSHRRNLWCIRRRYIPSIHLGKNTSHTAVPGILATGGGHFFVIGSCVGYVSSALYFYRNQILQAFAAFDDYPELRRLHLIMNFPLMRFQRMDLRPSGRREERAKLASSWMLYEYVGGGLSDGYSID